jgi:hypothetical protein
MGPWLAGPQAQLAHQARGQAHAAPRPARLPYDRPFFRRGVRQVVADSASVVRRCWLVLLVVGVAVTVAVSCLWSER